MKLTKSSGYWRVVARNALGQRVWRSLGAVESVTKSEALDRARKVLAHVGVSVVEPGTVPTLTAWLAQHRTLLVKHESASLAMHDESVGLMVKCLGDRLLTKYRPVDVARFKAWLAGLENKRDGGTIGEQTQHRHLRNCRAVFSHAKKLQLIDANPFAGQIGDAPPVKVDWRYVSDAEVARLMDKCRDDHWRAFIALMRWAGMRRGEALRLEWRDIEGDWFKVNERVRPGTKKRPRQTPIDPRIRPFLERVRAGTRPESPVVRVSRSSLHQRLMHLYGRAEVPVARQPYHSLRKSCRHDWRDKGLDSADIDQFLGHDHDVAEKHYNRTLARSVAAIVGSGANPC